MLIHAGYLTNQGSYSELKKAVEWLEQQDFEAKIVIAGNFFTMSSGDKSVGLTTLILFGYGQGITKLLWTSLFSDRTRGRGSGLVSRTLVRVEGCSSSPSRLPTSRTRRPQYGLGPKADHEPSLACLAVRVRPSRETGHFSMRRMKQSMYGIRFPKA